MYEVGDKSNGGSSIPGETDHISKFIIPRTMC